MDDLKKWQNRCIAHDMVETLKLKQFDAHYAEDLESAKKMVLDMIPENASIGLGGSVTLREMGFPEIFRQEPYRLIDRYSQPSWEAELQAYRDAQHSDFFVCGTNAITGAGELVNIDSSGNRVSAMIFGPQRVIVVAGVNKVVDSLEDAMKRLKKIAPLNCRRLGHKTPCAETGKCEDCSIPARMCNYTAIIHHGMKFEGRISIVLIADEIGF